jgi:hypothetical protein
MILFPEPATRFKIRASQASRFCANPKAYYFDWLTDQKFHNKYTEKGTFCEDEAIALLSELHNIKYKKNKRHYENAFITGTPDIKVPGIVHDIKCSWDITSFNNQKTLKKQYVYQMQVYMHLLKVKHAFVHFVGIDTPIRYMDGDENILDHQFSKLPINERIKTFYVAYNSGIIAEIKKTLDSREYLL